MARGRPTASRFIINANDIVDSALLTTLNFKLQDIHRVTATKESTIAWLARHQLLRNTMNCCGDQMGFVNRDRLSDGKAWYCRLCKSYKSIRKDSFFDGSNLPLDKLLELMYWWSIECKQMVVMTEVGIGTEAIVNWYNYFRDICAMYLIDHPLQLGGVGREVELDESKFMHRKYNRGRYREGNWVLGMVERGTRNCIMVPVVNRSAQTLLPIIQQHILPGTRVITDGWQAYNQVQNHAVVNHKLNFVDPNDPTIHTNSIEGTWGNSKAKYRAMHGTSDALFFTYIQEFLWRRIHNTNTFMNLIYWIQHYYPML